MVQNMNTTYCKYNTNGRRIVGLLIRRSKSIISNYMYDMTEYTILRLLQYLNLTQCLAIIYPTANCMHFDSSGYCT